jgi:hypothetical protein
MLTLFKRSWKGEASLAAAFWIVYFLCSLALGIIVGILFSLFVPNFTNPDVYIHYVYTIKAIISPYVIFSAICVWRCAKNSSMIWNVLARIIAVLAFIGSIYYILFALHIV